MSPPEKEIHLDKLEMIIHSQFQPLMSRQFFVGSPEWTISPEKYSPPLMFGMRAKGRRSK
jgi:hypothetical protein